MKGKILMTPITPLILKETAKGIQTVRPEDELYASRKLFLVGEVSSESMTALLMQLMCLEEDECTDEITLYINSPGGEVKSGLSVYDYIRQMKTPVRTVCIGTAASMGSILFLAGDKREMYPHSELMIHDPSTQVGSYEKPEQLRTRLESLVEVSRSLAEIISERSGMDIEEVNRLTKTDTYYNAQAALKSGLATSIINTNTKEEINND